MKRSQMLGVCLVLITLGLLAIDVPIISASEPRSCIYVQETGHNIHGAFMLFYESHGGAKNLGLPISEALLEDGIVVQYFTYARLEFIPQNSEPFRVRPSLLGTRYGITDPPVRPETIPPPNHPNFRYFPQTGLIVGFAIKEYYDTHNGSDLLGIPVSQLRYENSIFAQYFQNGRLEWNPTDKATNKVRPSPVGQSALEQRYPANFAPRLSSPNDWCANADVARSPVLVTPSDQIAPPSPSLVLDPRVQIRFLQAGTRGPQYVNVIVYDRTTGNPVPNVALYATVQFLQDTRVIPIAPTDLSGRATFSFDLGNQPAGATTFVVVNAYLGNQNVRVTEWFRH
jgi:hypothetical protein